MPERPRPSWMCGRATLTMVVSRTTMSWAVRMTNRNTVGLVSRRRREPDRPGFGSVGRFDGATGQGREKAWFSDLSAGIVDEAEASSG